jgi:hypothetical protein
MVVRRFAVLGNRATKAVGTDLNPVLGIVWIRYKKTPLYLRLKYIVG